MDAEDAVVPLVRLRDSLVEDVRPALLVLTAAVALVLLIGCANIANLLLARSTARRQEIAMRSALGASRWRLARQLLTESLVLSLVGGVVGVATARWYLPLLVALAPGELQRAHPALGWPVLAAALGLSMATGIVFGLAPAAQAVGHAGALASQGRVTTGRRARRVRDALVVGEVAVSLALLVAAALMIQSFAHLREVDPGFRTDHRLTARIDLPAERYPDGARQARFFDQLLERLAAAPGVEGAAAAGRLPFAGGNSSRGLDARPRLARAGSGRGHSGHQPGLLPRDGHPDPPRPRVRQLGSRRRRAGRHRGRDDGAPGPGPGEDALGRRFRIGSSGPVDGDRGNRGRRHPRRPAGRAGSRSSTSRTARCRGPS